MARTSASDLPSRRSDQSPGRRVRVSATTLLGSVAGGHVLARLSRRFGEGMINGALTARVGIAAMDVCRPVHFCALPRPRVTGITSRALTGLFGRPRAAASDPL